MKPLRDRLGRTIAQSTHGIEIPCQRLQRSCLRARLVHGDRVVDVDKLATQRSHSVDDAARVSADV